MAASFLKELPVHNKQNFTKFHNDSSGKSSHKKPPIFLPTKDNPNAQEIVTEKSNILLRYLHQQWEKKAPKKKRESTQPATEDEQKSKRARLDTDTASSRLESDTAGPSTDSS